MDKSYKSYMSRSDFIEANSIIGLEIGYCHRKIECMAKGGYHDMSENATPLAENQYVKELFSILQDNGRDSSGLSALLGHVNEMENFVKRAEDRIAEMKSQLADMKEVQNHPVKAYLQNAIKTLEHKVADVKERLGDLKANIIEGCKNAVTAFKEKGINALDKLASFFHIKQDLQDWKKGIDGAIKADDRAVAKIEAFASEYHSAGRAIKNMARVAVGKELIDAKKEAGKLAKTAAAPYKAQKSALTGLRKSIDKAITRLERLENSAAEKKSERKIEKKPSMLAKLDANKERVEREKRELPTPERTKSQELAV
jgi:cob(I)alamin adenosyltransferase